MKNKRMTILINITDEKGMLLDRVPLLFPHRIQLKAVQQIIDALKRSFETVGVRDD